MTLVASLKHGTYQVYVFDGNLFQLTEEFTSGLKWKGR